MRISTKNLWVFSCLLLAFAVAGNASAKGRKYPSPQADRKLWVNTLVKVAHPVLAHLADGTLKQHMPLRGLNPKRYWPAHLEAVGRTICGVSPWLELGPDHTEEGRLREKYIELAVKGLANAVNPSSPDYLDFKTPSQPLVDAAFLAQGLLRAPTQLWGRMDKETQQHMVAALKLSRNIQAFNNNWLLFASMVEAALLEFTGECDMDRLTRGVHTFRDKWYKGDGTYGDGASYHADYYNSFVIHPMLVDVLNVMSRHGLADEKFRSVQNKRFMRYAEQQERQISPEGAYPVLGRSIVYRVGAFHALSHAALLHQLPSTVQPAQVRCALSAVIKRQFSAPKTFDKEGWLYIGFAGNQINLAENYINTGSVYLCTVGFLALGLPQTDAFWSDPFTPWSGLKAWSGEDMKADHALD